MPVTKLTAAFCATAQCPPNRRKMDYYDTETKGFVLEVRVNGGKTFYLRFQDAHGRARQHRIAGYGDISLDRARKEAQRLRSQVVLGGDPAAAKAEKRAVPTYGELAARHLDYARTYQRSFDTTKGYMNKHIIPRWARARVSEISQPDVAKWLAEKRDEGLAPATVEKMRMIFHRSFELALRWNVAGVVRNPVKGISRVPINNARERSLNAAEVARLQRALEQSRNPQLKFFVGLLLATGARFSEVRLAQWQHVDLERRQWFIPTSKSGRARWVPLSQAAVDILNAVPRFDGCSLILPNPDTLKPFITLKHAWQTARDQARLPGLRLHDMRHAFASAAVSAGVDLFCVGSLLGHADHKSTMRYSHINNSTLMAAVEAGAKQMELGV